MTASRLFLASVILAAGFATAAQAQVTQDPDTGGNLNHCWGDIASQTAKLESPNPTSKGGGMGQHSRSSQAADINGGFAATDDLTGNQLNIEFNTKVDGGNAGREGVGNVSRGAPHSTHPGDGGNGQHAINNGQFAAALDPTTGQFTPNAPLTCD
jgi:hypothetical protein